MIKNFYYTGSTILGYKLVVNKLSSRFANKDEKAPKKILKPNSIHNNNKKGR